MEELFFRPRHAGESAEVGAGDPGEVDRSDRVVEAGVIPVMAIFLPGPVLLLGDHIAREQALQRAVPHGDLAGVAPLDVRAGPAYPLRRRPGALPEQWPHPRPRALRQFSHFDSKLSRSMSHFFPFSSIDLRRRIRLAARRGGDSACASGWVSAGASGLAAPITALCI